MNNIITTTKEHLFYFPALPAPLSSLPRKLELEQISIYPRTLFKDLKIRRNHTYLTVGCICIYKFCCSTFYFSIYFPSSQRQRWNDWPRPVLLRVWSPGSISTTWWIVRNSELWIPSLAYEIRISKIENKESLFKQLSDNSCAHQSLISTGLDCVKKIKLDIC